MAVLDSSMFLQVWPVRWKHPKKQTLHQKKLTGSAKLNSQGCERQEAGMVEMPQG